MAAGASGVEVRKSIRNITIFLAATFAAAACGGGGDGDGGLASPGSRSSGGVDAGVASSGATSGGAASGGTGQGTSTPPRGLDASSTGGSSLGGSGDSGVGEVPPPERDGAVSMEAAAAPETSAPDAAIEAGMGPVDGASPGGPYKGVANSACGDLTSLGVSWWYNWSLSPGGCRTAEFVPMVWGHTGNEQSAAGIASEVGSLVKGGYKAVLGFNEPDNATQSNIPVATAVALWPSFANSPLRVGSPATQGNAAGLAWIQNFMTAVNADTTGKLRVDFVATHWYGWNAGSCDPAAANLESWIKQIEAVPGGRPIWLTEWGCLNQSNPTAAVVQAFFSGAIAMLAKHPRVERYAWYPWTTNNALVAAGAMTGLGKVFAAAPATH